MPNIASGPLTTSSEGNQEDGLVRQVQDANMNVGNIVGATTGTLLSILAIGSVGFVVYRRHRKHKSILDTTSTQQKTLSFHDEALKMPGQSLDATIMLTQNMSPFSP